MTEALLKSRRKFISGFRWHFEGDTDAGIDNRNREMKRISHRKRRKEGRVRIKEGKRE